MKKPVVSIIIVQYKVPELLFACIESVKKHAKDIEYEMIVVDNDEIKSIKTDLLKKFPDVAYIPNVNKGFGQGNNVGVKHAKGKYLFFLNPDTITFENTINEQVQFLEKNNDVGIVAPILLDKEKKIYDFQGFGELTFIRAIFSLTFLNKYFSKNGISKGYWLPDWDKKKIKEVGVVPGTAFMMERELFERVGGFDEKFFLYFEEFDLCKRVKDLGYRICMLPQTKVTHLWGESTKQRSDINAIFQDSRFYYFQKHYGLLQAFLVECVTRLSRESTALLLIIVASGVLSLNKIASGMIFIGDQAWFYLSARDLLLGNAFPLVGITSSHTWLHQGPMWAYLLSIAFWIGGYNPLTGAYLSIVCNLLTIFFIYLLGKRVFTRQIAILSAALYAFSPYLLELSRMPYHTTPIPLLSLFYFFGLTQWMRGKVSYFPCAIFLLVLLYNFELATVILVFPLLLIAVYGFWKKSSWITRITKKELLSAIVLGGIPLIPIFFYDFSHGFKQTAGFGAWMVYTAVRSFLHLFSHSSSSGSIGMVGTFLLERIQWLIFLPNLFLSSLFALGSIGGLIVTWYQYYKSNRENSSYLLLMLWIFASVGIIISNKTPSDAYLPILFPALFFSIAVASVHFIPRRILLLGVILFILLNVATLLKHNYSMTPHRNILLCKRANAVDTMISLSDGKPFRIVGKGIGSQFESFIMPYEYLAWYQGHPVSNTSKNTFIVEEKNSNIIVTQKK